MILRVVAVNQPTMEGGTGGGESSSGYASLKRQVEAINNMSYSNDLLACKDCESIYNDPELSILSKGNRIANYHLNKGLRFNILSEWFGSESEWQGKEGWENKGYPTMVNTWGVLSTAISGGVLAFEIGALYTSTGAFATASNANIFSAAGEIGAFSIGAMNTASGIYGSNHFMFKYTNRAEYGINIMNSFIKRDPLAIYGAGMQTYQYYLDMRSSFNRSIGISR